jgi:hypothetical protein
MVCRRIGHDAELGSFLPSLSLGNESPFSLLGVWLATAMDQGHERSYFIVQVGSPRGQNRASRRGWCDS